MGSGASERTIQEGAERECESIERRTGPLERVLTSLLLLLQYILLSSRPPSSEVKEYFFSVVRRPHAEIVGETDLDLLQSSPIRHFRQSRSYLSLSSQDHSLTRHRWSTDINSKSPASKLASLLSLHSSLFASSRTVIFASSKSSLKSLQKSLQLSELSSSFSLRSESVSLEPSSR